MTKVIRFYRISKYENKKNERIFISYIGIRFNILIIIVLVCVLQVWIFFFELPCIYWAVSDNRYVLLYFRKIEEKIFIHNAH